MFITFIILSLHSIFDFIFRTFLTHGATQTYPTILGKCLSTSLPLFRLHHSLSRLYTFIYTTRMVLSKHFFLPNSQFPFLSHSLVTNGAIFVLNFFFCPILWSQMQLSLCHSKIVKSYFLIVVWFLGYGLYGCRILEQGEIRVLWEKLLF